MKLSLEYRTRVLSPEVRRHLQSVTETSGLPSGDESLEKITENWLEKRKMFEDQTRLLGMILTDQLPNEDSRGMILLTYSGSLCALGRAGSGGRWFEYASIELRKDVPSLMKARGVRIEGSVAPNKPVRFMHCPIEQSSDILLIATCPALLPPAEEELRLREATVFLTNGFVKVNRTLTVPDDTIEHFTMKSMVSYLARKHDLSLAQTSALLADYLSMAEAGLLMGERVPLGNIGRLYLSRRPAQKARIGRNPRTGAEITISAKPEVLVPRISFSSRMKERAALMPVTEEDEGTAPK